MNRSFLERQLPVAHRAYNQLQRFTNSLHVLHLLSVPKAKKGPTNKT